LLTPCAGACGAFFFLSDGHTQYVLAGSVQKHGVTQLLGHTDADSEAWKQFGQQFLEASSYHAVVTHDLSRNEHLKHLSTVTGLSMLRFCVAAPIISKADIAIGYLVVVDTNEHGATMSDREAGILSSVAKQCMNQLQQDYEMQLERRGSRMTQGFSTYLQTRPAVEHMLEDPPSYSELASRVNFNNKAESEKLEVDSTEQSTDGAVPRSGGMGGPDSHTREPSDDIRHDETPYRRIFRRSAEYLRKALDADGVMFADGLIGFHGILHASTEPEQELEHELIEGDKEKLAAADSKQTHEVTHARSFTSADFRKHVKTQAPAEILGLDMLPDIEKPALTQLSQSTLGLNYIDEGCLQYLMSEFAGGKVWYWEKGPYRCEGHTVSPDDTDHTKRVTQAFPGVCQLMFAPLTDPVNIKRLAVCFV
jgi:hypothetical protein